MVKVKIKAGLGTGPTSSSVGVVVQELVSRQNKRRDLLQDTNNMYARAAVYLDRWAQVNIRTEGKNVGGWVPFKYGGRWVDGSGDKPGYFDPAAKLLRDTGRLAASILPFSSDTNAGIMTDLPYARFHNEGEGTPERRIMPVKEEIIDEVKKIITGHIVAAINLNKGVVE